MQNLDILEGVYNDHIEAFNRATDDNRGNSVHFEYGYLCGIEYVLQLFAIEFEFDKAGYITIKQEAEQ